MKLSEIKIFIKDLEQTIVSLGFLYTEIKGSYLAKYESKEVLIVPYIDNMDIEIPSEYDGKNMVVVSSTSKKINSLNIKTFSLYELKKLVINRDILSKYYNRIINIIFFNGNSFNLIDLLIESMDSKMADKHESLNCSRIKDIPPTNVLSTSDVMIENKIDISIIEQKLSIKLEKRKKHYANDEYGIVAIISKFYPDKGSYWYGYHDYQIDLLSKYKTSYMSFYFKNRREVLLLPLAFIEKYRSKLNSTTNSNGTYWHIYIRFHEEKCLWQIPNNGFMDVSHYLIKTDKIESTNVSDINIDPIEDVNAYSGPIIKIKNKSFHESKVKK